MGQAPASAIRSRPAAIGEVLGRRRRRPLPIGSIKTNIGHIEPESGLAGMMKAMLALKSRRIAAFASLRRT